MASGSGSDHLIDQGQVGFEAPEVLEEVLHQGRVFAVVSTRGVGRDVAVGRGEQGMSVRQGLGFGDIEPCGSKAAGTQGAVERRLIHGGSPSDVVEHGPGLEGGEDGFVHELSGGGVVGKEIDQVIDFRKDHRQLLRGNDPDGFVAAGLAAQGGDLHAEGGEKGDQVFGDGSVAEDEDGLAAGRARQGPETKPVGRTVGGTGGQLNGQSPGLGHHEGEDMLGAGLGIDLGTVGDPQSPLPGEITKGGGVIARVAGAGEMDPAQSFGGADAVEIRLSEGDLGVEEGGIGFGFGENRGGGPTGLDQRVASDAGTEEVESVAGDGKVGVEGEGVHWMGRRSSRRSVPRRTTAGRLVPGR